MKKSVYEMVTERIMEELENGVVPWRRPWVSGGAVNWKTQKPYLGINTFLLPRVRDVQTGHRSWRDGEERGKV